jgi:hypothetical protein
MMLRGMGWWVGKAGYKKQEQQSRKHKQVEQELSTGLPSCVYWQTFCAIDFAADFRVMMLCGILRPSRILPRLSATTTF